MHTSLLVLEMTLFASAYCVLSPARHIKQDEEMTFVLLTCVLDFHEVLEICAINRRAVAWRGRRRPRSIHFTFLLALKSFYLH